MSPSSVRRRRVPSFASCSLLLLVVTLASLLFAVSQFETEFYISGLAPLWDQLVVLSYVKEVSEKTVICFHPQYNGKRGSSVLLCPDHVAPERTQLQSKQNLLTHKTRSTETALQT